MRLLFQISYGIPRTPYHVALVLLINAGDDFHQCRFTCTVQTYNTYLGSIKEGEVYVLKYLFLILLDGFANSNHREDDFLVVGHNCRPSP